MEIYRKMQALKNANNAWTFKINKTICRISLNILLDIFFLTILVAQLMLAAEMYVKNMKNRKILRMTVEPYSVHASNWTKAVQ